ncbi:hypothetical protein [Paraburkholderia sp. BCC1886]|uniref:hypothetical protein n=1 Tax=Paraburkholderia sp. BCC1886 TaxID=2562670 RepID=UPI001183E451|nr:hypothetical protein [Paraburkholderia sp. BCC1886]
MYTAVDGVWLDGLQFCREAYRLFERLLAEPDGVKRLRLRTHPFERKLITEILPLAHYLKSSYSLGRYIDVCWHSGNQPFDAEFRQRGEFVEQRGLPKAGFFEITTAQHPNDHLARERLETEGFLFSVHDLKTTATKRNPHRKIISAPVVFSNGSFIEDMAGFILDEIVRKVAKGYPPGFTLIVRCSLNHLYLSDEWTKLVGKVRQSLPESSFGEIWMCDDERPDERKAILNSSP